MKMCELGDYSHTIQYGDTLWKLARRYNTTIEKLIEANPDIEPNNLVIGQIICIPFDEATLSDNIEEVSDPILDLNNHLRTVLLDHIIWVKAVVESFIYDLPGNSVLEERLLKNAEDFFNLFKVFYGEVYAKEIQDLIKNQFILELNYLIATKKIDNQAMEGLELNWHENVAELAELFGKLNPYISVSQLRNMLFEHIEQTKLQILYLINKNYEESIEQFDEAKLLIFEISDLLLSAIVNQFPSIYK